MISELPSTAQLQLWRRPAGLALATRWIGVLTPVGIVAGPSFGDIFCSLTALLFLIHAGWTRDLSWLKQRWLLAGLGLWAYLCLRAGLAEEPGAALSVAGPFIRFLLFAAALQTLVLRQARWRARLALFALAALGALALDGLLQYVRGFDILGRPRWSFRLTAFYRHAWVGAVLAWLFLPVALALLDAKRPRLAAGFAALALLVIFLSGDRMALLCAAMQIVLLALLARPARRFALIGVPLFGLAAGAVLLVSPRMYERQIVSTVETVKSFGTSHYAVIWTSALKMARTHPVFGLGPKGFRAHCPDPRYGPLYPVREGEMRCATHPHNTYLEWLVDGGVIGLGLFLAMAFFLLRALRPPSFSMILRWAGVGLFITLLARLWPLASWTSFHHAWSAVPFWLVVGWGLAQRGEAPSKPPPSVVP